MFTNLHLTAYYIIIYNTDISRIHFINKSWHPCAFLLIKTTKRLIYIAHFVKKKPNPFCNQHRFLQHQNWIKLTNLNYFSKNAYHLHNLLANILFVQSFKDFLIWKTKTTKKKIELFAGSRESRGSRDSSSIEVLSAPSSPSEQTETSSSQIGRNPLRGSKCN